MSSIRRHIIGSPLGSTLLTDVTPGKIDLFLSGKEKGLSARSVNHLLRHTTASLLLMSGADLAAVQRIMRHQDPRLTTEVYGHLVDELPQEAKSSASASVRCRRTSAQHRRALRAASLLGGRRIGAAATRRHARDRALCGSVSDGIYYPATTRPPSGALGAPSAPNGCYRNFANLSLVGARGFEPPAFRSRTERYEPS